MQIKKRSAGVVLVRTFEEATRYLLLRCYNYWDFPKGESMSGEELLVTAQREVAEETGLTELSFEWSQVYIETPPYGAGKVARYYIAASPSGDVFLPVNPELGHPEHHEFRWASFDEAHALLGPRLRVVLEWARDMTTGFGA